MGQVHVASVQVGQLPAVFAALDRAGFAIAQAEGQAERRYRCRRGGREIILNVSPGRQDSDEVLVVLPYPPYTVLPWWWGSDGRFFGDITDVLDGFHYRD